MTLLLLLFALVACGDDDTALDASQDSGADADDAASDAADDADDGSTNGPIACGEDLTCEADEKCVNVCDCCGAFIPDGGEAASHFECRPCEGGVCTGSRQENVPCA